MLLKKCCAWSIVSVSNTWTQGKTAHVNEKIAPSSRDCVRFFSRVPLCEPTSSYSLQRCHSENRDMFSKARQYKPSFATMLFKCMLQYHCAFLVFSQVLLYVSLKKSPLGRKIHDVCNRESSNRENPYMRRT